MLTRLRGEREEAEVCEIERDIARRADHSTILAIQFPLRDAPFKLPRYRLLSFVVDATVVGIYSTRRSRQSRIPQRASLARRDTYREIRRAAIVPLALSRYRRLSFPQHISFLFSW